jgi:hypothetical protein
MGNPLLHRLNRRQKHAKKGIAAIIGGIIIFGIVFSVGYGYLYFSTQNIKALNATDNSKATESYTVTGGLGSSGNITVSITNNGPIAITLVSIIISNSSQNVLKVATSASGKVSPSLPISINPGQTSASIDTGVAQTLTAIGSYTIKVLSQRGNLVAALYPSTNPNVNKVIATQNGPVGIVFDSFSFFYGYNNPYKFGDGYQIGGYYGSIVPQSDDGVFQIKVQDSDPQGRSLTISTLSSLIMGPGANSGPGSGSVQYYIVGDLSEYSNCASGMNCVQTAVYSPITIPYQGYAILNFSAAVVGGCTGKNSPCQVAPNTVSGTVPMFFLLFGHYGDSNLFGQTIPYVADYGTSATLSSTSASTTTPISGLVNCARGTTYSFSFSGFSNAPQVYLINSAGAVSKITTGTTTTSTASFVVPTSLALHSYYEVFVSDGINAVYATVYTSA